MIQLDGRAVEYEVHGAGDTVVLCQPTWWPLDPWRLSGVPELSPGYRLLLFNHRGIGGSPGTDTEYTIDSMASDTLALMSSLNIEQAHLVTFANGSIVALRVAELAPDRVRSLVLGAPGSPASTAPRRVSEGARRHIAEIGYETFIRGHAVDPELFSPATYKAHPERGEALSDAMWKHEGTEEEYFKHALARTSFDVLREIDRVTQPVLVMTGTEDTIARGDSNPVETSRLIAGAIPQATLELVPGVKHMLYWEAPEGWARVLEFLSRV